jgi:hypothetical protein
MTTTSQSQLRRSGRGWHLAGAVFGTFLLVPALFGADRTLVVPKWQRLELTFKSSIAYDDPVQQATLLVTFVSPLGETNAAWGFWDGGKTWRVRFSPGQPGHWTYRTQCSDRANTGLDGQSGEFVCGGTLGAGLFVERGPVRIAYGRPYFEFADGTAFFWMADAAWNAGRISTPKDWTDYAIIRNDQKFTAIQWAAIPGADDHGESALSGGSAARLNLEFFRRMDEKIATLNHVGLLSVIAPFWEQNAQMTDSLPEPEVAGLLRYMVARWGADNVAWLIAPSARGGTERWRQIGREVFAKTGHAPVVLFVGRDASVAEQFENEFWVDAFGYAEGIGAGGGAGAWTLPEPLAGEWKSIHKRPVINVLPAGENEAAPGDVRVTSAQARRGAWESVFAAPPAGVTYSAFGVADWNTAGSLRETATSEKELPFWEKSLFLPGAKQMAHVADLFSSCAFWRLRPATASVVGAAEQGGASNHAAALASEAKGLTFVYVPEGGAVELSSGGLPQAPSMSWVNPRTGEMSPAMGGVAGEIVRVTAPGEGDWVLMIKAGK